MKNNDNDTELFDAKLDELLSELRSGTINFDADAKQAIRHLFAEEMKLVIGVDDTETRGTGQSGLNEKYWTRKTVNRNELREEQRARLCESKTWLSKDKSWKHETVSDEDYITLMFPEEQPNDQL